MNDIIVSGINKAIEEIIKEDNAKEEINSEKTQRDEFLDYLKVVSEKGIDQVKKDAAKQQEKAKINCKIVRFRLR